MGRQYLACRFRPHDRKAFTYHNDGDPMAVGDVVKVPDKSGDGWQRVTVSAIVPEKPSFPTKGIIGLVEVETGRSDAEHGDQHDGTDDDTFPGGE